MPVMLRWLLRLGPTNPITVRLVQNGSRRLRHLYIRSGYLAALILVLLWVLVVMSSKGTISYRELAHAGAAAFEDVAYLQIGLICILAPVFMAGAIAQEASPRTWEVLLTTPLGALQIVLGNLLGRLFFILALLMSSLPLFALTQYFGGVPGRSIFASYAIAGCAALLVGTIAIALSVSRLVGRRAVFAFYVAVVSYLVVTYAVDYWIRAGGHGVGPTGLPGTGSGVTWMTAINPFLALNALLDTSNYPKADAGSVTGLASWFLAAPVKTWCFGSILLSLVLVGLSTITVRIGGLGNLAGTRAPGAVPWYRKIFGLGSAGAEFRPPRAVWHNPIAWREAAARNSTLGRILARWSFIAAGGLWGIGLVAMYFWGELAPKEFQLALIATVIGELAVTTLVGINMAATAVSREREDGTLDLLLTTPITPGQYLTGKLRGLIAYLLPLLAVPIGTLLLAGLYVMADGLGGKGVAELKVNIPRSALPAVTLPVVLPEAGILAALVFVPFVAFVVMTGLQWSLKSKGTLSSVVGTVAVVGVLSGVVGLCGGQAGDGMGIFGAAVAATSPASLVIAVIHPEQAMRSAVEDPGLNAARVALVIGAVVAAGAYVTWVYGVHGYMVKQFDFTVRKLAGAK